MSDVTNGIGGTETVDNAGAEYDITVDPGTSGSHKTATTLKVWNTGSEVLYVTVNTKLASHDEASAVPIPAGESFWFVGQPLRYFCMSSTATGTTASWGAF